MPITSAVSEAHQSVTAVVLEFLTRPTIFSARSTLTESFFLPVSERTLSLVNSIPPMDISH